MTTIHTAIIKFNCPINTQLISFIEKENNGKIIETISDTKVIVTGNTKCFMNFSKNSNIVSVDFAVTDEAKNRIKDIVKRTGNLATITLE